MVMSTLKKKFFRSFKQYGIQLVSISVMLILGIAVFIGLNTTWRSLDLYIKDRSKDYNISDIVMIYEPTRKDYKEEIKKISNIKDAEDFLSLRAEAANQSKGELEVNFIPEEAQINRYQVTKGTNNIEGSNCILDSSYATENRIDVGDSLTVIYEGIEKTFKVAGLANTPAYVYSVSDSTEVIPNHKKFGFVYTNIGNGKDFTGGIELRNKSNIVLKNKKQIDHTKNELENLSAVSTLGIIKNSESLNYLATNQKIEQYKSIGNLFPIVFFAVVILMTFTTMYRIINKERSSIGILKALGYGNFKLIFHYLSYGLWISIIGIVFGVFIGWKIVPMYIWNFFEELFILPEAQIAVDADKVVFVTLVSILSTSIATLYVYLKINQESPSALLRAQTGAKGKHILLEKIRPIWNKLLPSKKLTLRQMFRNKVRLFMTVIGVMGCTALLISALGIRDTVDNVVKTVYSQTYLYDEKIIVNSDSNENKINSYLDKDKSAEKLEELSLPMESTSKKKLGSLHIIEENSHLIKFYDNGQELKLNSNSVLVTQKMSDIYDLKIGDKIRIQLSPQKNVEFKITDIAKINIGQGIYITSAYWENINQMFRPTSIIKKSNSYNFPKEAITKIIKTADQEQDFVSSMKSTVSMSVMLIAAAAILAIVVLYNLGYLNFAERERDLATLSVLGFYERELKRLLSLENTILSIVGIILGIPIGNIMHRKIFESAGMGDELDFTPIIYSSSLLVAIVFTLVLVLLVNFVLNKKIKKIEMTQALKSVE